MGYFKLFLLKQIFMESLDNFIFNYQFVFYFIFGIIQFIRVLWNNEIYVFQGWEDVENSQGYISNYKEKDIIGRMLVFFTFFWNSEEYDNKHILNLKNKVNFLSKLTFLIFPIIIFVLLYSFGLDNKFENQKIDLLYFLR